MTNKEALELLYSDAKNYAYFNETEEDLSEIKAEYELIKQDLERLEQLEKAVEVLKSYRLTAEYVEGYYTQPIIMFNPADKDVVVVGITMEEYELLKEVL